MPNKTWKSMERRVAKRFGTKRNPLSGEASRHTRSDTLHPDLYIECKHGKEMPLLKLMHDVEEKAHKEKKTPVLVIHKTGERHDYYLLRETDLLQIAANHLTASATPS